MKLVRVAAVVAAGALAAAGLLLPSAHAAPVNTALTPAVDGEKAVDRLDASLRIEAGVVPTAAASRGPVTKPRRDAQGRTVVYVQGDTDQAARKAVAAAGGTVSDGAGGLVRAAVPGDKLVTLAGQQGVREVRRPDEPVPMAITSEGAQLSKALDWRANGQQGAGIKVGILDVGFGRLEATQAQGELPATGVTTYDGNCGAEHSSSHGTTMAEVVHDMAPKASLYLACVTDTLDFDDAARWLQQQGVRVVSISMAFPGVARGDGRVDGGAANWDPATVVRWLRGANILVVAAAGNEAKRHWTNQVLDSDNNKWMNIWENGQERTEAQSFSVPARGDVPGSTSVTVELRWDAWPLTNTDLDVFVMSEARKPEGLNDPALAGRFSIRPQATTTGGLTPFEKVTFDLPEETSVYWVYVQIKAFQLPSVNGRYDLTIYGPADGLSHTDPQGSIAEPATSPFALAVGAITPENQAASGRVEDYSGRGPTIDGRLKPDLTGFTSVSTFTGGVKPNRTLTGTSVAAAHVAGAAAVLLGANPQLDASQLEADLRTSASRQTRATDFGYGVLDLGNTRTPTPQKGSAYTPLSLKRVLDTFSDVGGHPGSLKTAEEFTLRIPNLPADTTAVVLKLTGFPENLPANTTTQLEVYPDLGRRTGVVAMEVTAEKIGETMTIATLDPVNKVIRIRNSVGNLHLIADLIGYFSTESSASTYFPLRQSVRIQDTKASSLPNAKYGPREKRKLQVRGVAGVPANATAAVVNVTASEATEYTHLDVYSTTPYGAWALSPYVGEELTHSVIVPIAEDGTFQIFNELGSVHLSVDLVGWFAPGAGARYVPLRYPTRVVDTRTGMAAPRGQLGPSEATGVTVSGVGTVPFNATGTVVALRPGLGPRAAKIRLATYANDFGWSGHQSLISNSTVRHSQSNVAFTPLGATGELQLRNHTGQADAGMDLWGYFVGGQPVSEAPLPAPSGWWQFDDREAFPAVADSSGGGRTATVAGGMTWNGGRAGGSSGSFDGTGYATTASSVVRSDQSFTVSSWVAMLNANQSYTIASQNATNLSPFTLGYSQVAQRWTLSASASDDVNAVLTRTTSPEAPQIGRWTHLAGVYDAPNKRVRLYVNGTLAGESNNVTMWAPASPGSFVIGAERKGTAYVNKIPGLVDDVRTYSVALQESQVRKLYADTPRVGRNVWQFDEGSGTVAKSAGWPNQNLTLASAAAWTPSGIAGSALALNGTASSYASMAGMEVEMPGSYSVSAWAKLTAADRTQSVLSQDGGIVRGFALQFRNETSPRWSFTVPKTKDTTTSADQWFAWSAKPPALGQWTHLVGTWDAGSRQLRLYVNGELEGAQDGVVPWAATGNLQVGRNQWGGAQTDFFGGSIDDVRTWMGTLSPAEVRQLYRERVPG